VSTINLRVHAARRRLQEAGIPLEEAALDARLLAGRVLGWDGARTLASGNDSEPSGFIEHYDVLIQRRIRREPVAYITGAREFWNLTFEVTPDVLIPRPETEGLVEALLELFPARDAKLRIADVCTGSGCVAVAIAAERPLASVVGTDVSAAALGVARRNAKRHRAARVFCVQSNLLQAIGGSLDAIVSNPPYVPAAARDGLQPEVRNFEPPLALFAGPDGLAVTRRLVREAPVHLNAQGYLVFEFGDGQETAICELISSTPGLRMIRVKNDLRGIPRIAVVQRT
jgi:release factor glutamine methyltransferase